MRKFSLKKLLLGLGTLTAAAIPAVTAVACADQKPNNSGSGSKIIPRSEIFTNVERTYNYNIHDGDTVYLEGQGLRLFGIDTAEVSYPPTDGSGTWIQPSPIETQWGSKATQLMRDLTNRNNHQTQLSFEKIKKDSFGRDVSLIEYYSFSSGTPTLEDWGLKLVKEGLARVAYVSPTYLIGITSVIKNWLETNYIPELKQAEKVAKEQKKGIWSLSKEDLNKVFPKALGHA